MADAAVQHDHFCVSDAGSPEVNGIYKNLDGNSNDNTLNYKLVKPGGGSTFKLYRSPSEDQSVRYWIIEERNKDYFYLAICKNNLPPQNGWTPYVAGKPKPPEVTSIPREVEQELRTRIENKDMITTLDLTNEYGAHCPTDNLKRAYKVIWQEQPEDVQKAIKAEAASKKKRKKPITTVKRKIQLTIQVGLGGSSEVSKQTNFQITVPYDAIVHYLKETIANRYDQSAPDIKLMFKGHKILSDQAALEKLGIGKGSTVIALGVNQGGAGKRTNTKRRGNPGLPVLDEDAAPSKEDNADLGLAGNDSAGGMSKKGKEKSCKVM